MNIEFTNAKPTDNAMNTTATRFHALTQHLPDTVMVFDRQARHLFVNEAVRAETGIAPKDFIGKTHRELGFPPEFCAFCEEQIERTFETGKMQEVELKLPSACGSLTLDWRLFPLTEPDGIVSVLAISRDMSELRRAKSQYEALFAEMMDGFALHELVCDNTGKPVDYRFLAVNPAFERLTGLKAGDVVGRNVLDVVPNLEPVWMEKYGHVVLTGEPLDFEEYSTPIGKCYHVRAFRPEPGKIACLFSDITDRKRVEMILNARLRISLASLEGNDAVSTLRRMFEGVCDLPCVEAGVAYTFHVGENVLEAVCHKGVSEAFAKAVSSFDLDAPHVAMLKTGAPVIGCFDQVKNIFDPVCEQEGLKAVAMFPVVFQAAIQGVIIIATKSRSEFPDATLQAIKAVVPEITAAMRRTIVEQKLRNALVAAETASRAKNVFLSVISHEVRTPLNAILGFTELALESHLDEEQRHFLDIVKRRARDLLEILNNILDLTRLDAEKLDVEVKPFDFYELIRGICRFFTIDADKKNLEFSCEVAPEIPAVLLGDSMRLKQVLLNLIGNAIKFTERGSVSVAVTLAPGEQPKDAARLLVSISDTGIGIPADKRQVIFEPFTQADDSSTRRHGGVGLGLSVAQHLLKLMGGAIWCESEQGKGSSFFFTVLLGVQPFSKATQAASDAPAAPSSRRLSILVVDDDDDGRILARRILCSMGHDVGCAANGNEALEKLGERDYDVVFMDVRMPALDGLEATRRIRDKSFKACMRDVPIIAMTAGAMQSDEKKCLDAGMTDYVAKPVSYDSIRAALNRVILV